MAKKKASSPDWRRKRLEGQKVVLVGSFPYSWSRADVKKFVETEGAEVAKSVTASLLSGSR